MPRICAGRRQQAQGRAVKMKPYYEEISDTVLEIFEKDNEGGIVNFEES